MRGHKTISAAEEDMRLRRADEPWPLAAAVAAAAAAAAAAALALKSDRILNALNEGVEKNAVQSSALSIDSTRALLALVSAYAAARVPVDELKVRLLESGALRSWGRLISSFDTELLTLGLGATTGLLEGVAPLACFRRSEQLYRQLVEYLPPLLHESEHSRPLEHPAVLLDSLRIACAITSHPAFLDPDGDRSFDWIWERMLEQSARLVLFDPLAPLYWAAVSAAVAAKPEVARSMLLNPSVRALLPQLAGLDDGSGSTPPTPLPATMSDDELPWQERLADEWLEAPRGDKTGGRGTVAIYTTGTPIPAESGAAHPAVQVLRVDAIAAGDPAAWEQRDEATRAYAREALRCLAEAAGTLDTSDMPPEEYEAWHAPLYDSRTHEPRAPPPPLPPASALDAVTEPTPVERGVELLSSMACCTVSGALWGALRGTRGGRVLRTTAYTALGANLFEAAFELKCLLVSRAESAWLGEVRIPPGDAPCDEVLAVAGAPVTNYAGNLGFATACAADAAVSAQLLWRLTRLLSAPYLLGGWLLGRACILASDVADLEVELVRE